jgi:dihydropteroate synthase
MLFRARQFEFSFPRPVLVMGIVNVTPDSFSDGGKFLEGRAAVKHALALAAEGAEILDIGGESSRPGAGPVDEAEELHRVIPIIEQLVGKTRVPLSIDTTKPGVARAALEAGVSIVNDVAAHRQNAAMSEAVAEFHAGYICMHARSSPAEKQDNPIYQNVVDDVSDFFCSKLKILPALGVQAEQIMLDPGIGFGKTLDHNLQLLANLRTFTRHGRPLLLGVSRKSFIANFSGAEPNERLPASLACATLAIQSGISVVRVHDVAATVQAVRMTEAILARKTNVD